MPPLFLMPLADDNTDRQITPWINYTLIVFNVLTFVVLQGAGENIDFTFAFSTVPAEITSGEDIVSDDQLLIEPRSGEQYLIPGLRETPIPVYWTLLTSMFMHGGWLHLLGNMLFLWIFGDNIEDDLGHARYLVYYLLCGLLASLAHVFMNSSGEAALIPCLGASGAISGVLGAYLIMHSHRKVHVLVLFRFIATVPGLVAIGMWFAMQIIGGMGSLAGQGDGVAYAAHIGGFVAGGILIFLFVPKNARRQIAAADRRTERRDPIDDLAG